MKRKILSLILALALTGCLAVSAHEVPDLTQNGSITFSMDWNGQPLDGGSLTIYRVGSVAEENGNYTFSCVPEIDAVSLDDLNDPALAAGLAEAAQDAGLETITAPISGGAVRFADVAPGLYVVVQTEPTEGFAPLSPFLISMPRFEDGRYITDVTAKPKVPLETEPTEPPATEPTAPPDPSLPQTGQLNWPVPLLAVGGLALFTFGWFLRFCRKKETYEK